jgi:hypothetical protein
MRFFQGLRLKGPLEPKTQAPSIEAWLRRQIFAPIWQKIAELISATRPPPAAEIFYLLITDR